MCLRANFPGFPSPSAGVRARGTENKTIKKQANSKTELGYPRAPACVVGFNWGKGGGRSGQRSGTPTSGTPTSGHLVRTPRLSGPQRATGLWDSDALVSAPGSPGVRKPASAPDCQARAVDGRRTESSCARPLGVAVWGLSGPVPLSTRVKAHVGPLCAFLLRTQVVSRKRTGGWEHPSQTYNLLYLCKMPSSWGH